MIVVATVLEKSVKLSAYRKSYLKIKLEIRGVEKADMLVVGSKTTASICCCMETRYELLPSATVVQG